MTRDQLSQWAGMRSFPEQETGDYLDTRIMFEMRGVTQLAGAHPLD